MAKPRKSPPCRRSHFRANSVVRFKVLAACSDHIPTTNMRTCENKPIRNVVFTDSPQLGQSVKTFACNTDIRRHDVWSRSIRLWDSETGKYLPVFPVHSPTIRTAAWSHDHRQILSASHDPRYRFGNRKQGRCLRLLEGHEACAVNTVSATDHRSVLLYDSSGAVAHLPQRCLLPNHSRLFTAATPLRSIDSD